MPFLNRIGSGSTNKFGFRMGFVPGAPTSVTASLPSTYGNTTASVSWTAPVMLGSPALNDYVIQYSSDSGSTFTTFSDGVSTSTSVTVTGLTNGTAYVFRVAAVNTIGTGAYSSASNSVTPLHSKIPTPLFTMDDGTQGRVGINFSNYLQTVDQTYVANPSGLYFYNYFDCAGGFCPNDTSGDSHGWTGLGYSVSRSAYLKVQRFGYADSDTVFCSETSPDAPPPDPCAGSPAAGTVTSGNYCSGTTLVRNVSDGCNGSTVQTVESNSATCGGVPPDPCAGVTCPGTCGDTTGYTDGGIQTANDPFGNCPGCTGTTYRQWNRACCDSLACWTGNCGTCPPPPSCEGNCTNCGEHSSIPGVCTDFFGGCSCFYYQG